ncbi:4Fe-4S binding domain protein [Providencia alcalifaciens DSM 30120]|uniref:4Fe-4S binding domain protein n=2 Tax=Providencia alcalifaciens TaxID=126385 RepID=B6XDS8_9GAMM|nr:4Fe-4S binding domain protein [Providencia alcalifaciens DSM 30120]
MERPFTIIQENMMNRFIIADPKKCIGCHTCEVACVVSHQEQETGIATVVKDEFFPRIHVLKGYTISTAVICRQCEDAPCANVCPNGAISRKDDFVYVDQSKCIGCKTCVIACPYGTMEVIIRPVAQQTTALNTIPQYRAEAHKCDLCHTREGGPACVEVCPTEALMIVDRNKMDEIIKERRRRAAFEMPADILS